MSVSNLETENHHSGITLLYLRNLCFGQIKKNQQNIFACKSWWLKRSETNKQKIRTNHLDAKQKVAQFAKNKPINK